MQREIALLSEAAMLDATNDERAHVNAYMASCAPESPVTFLQKMHSENVLGRIHDVWDVHCDKGRWWVITNPTNLYSQDSFPNLDLAVTVHVGLCLRIPRSERHKPDNLATAPFVECTRLLTEVDDALSRAQEVSDYQAIGVRCRELVLAFTNSAQDVFPWALNAPKPKRADVKAWVDHICNSMMPGDTHKERRSLLKAQLKAAWDFDNWLAHSKSSTWSDAEAAVEATGQAVGLILSRLIRHLRGAPDACPACGSHRLTADRGIRTEIGRAHV